MQCEYGASVMPNMPSAAHLRGRSTTGIYNMPERCSWESRLSGTTYRAPSVILMLTTGNTTNGLRLRRSGLPWNAGKGRCPKIMSTDLLTINPVKARLDISTVCQLRCVLCPTEENNGRAFLKTGRWLIPNSPAFSCIIRKSKRSSWPVPVRPSSILTCRKY